MENAAGLRFVIERRVRCRATSFDVWLPQFMHLQRSVQYRPFAKQSQYIFSQRDWRQLQCVASSVSNPISASASFGGASAEDDDVATLLAPIAWRGCAWRGEIELTTGALGELDAALSRSDGILNGDDIALPKGRSGCMVRKKN